MKLSVRDDDSFVVVFVVFVVFVVVFFLFLSFCCCCCTFKVDGDFDVHIYSKTYLLFACKISRSFYKLSIKKIMYAPAFAGDVRLLILARRLITARFLVAMNFCKPRVALGLGQE